MRVIQGNAEVKYSAVDCISHDMRESIERTIIITCMNHKSNDEVPEKEK